MARKKVVSKRRTKTASKRRSSDEIRRSVTDRIIEAIKNGSPPWRRPWSVGRNGGSPCNFLTGRRYTGINPLILLMTGFASKNWGTAKAWNTHTGCLVKKGEKATWVTLWRMVPQRDDNGNIVYDEKGKEKKYPLLREFPIFNAEQMNPLNKDAAKKLEKYLVTPGEDRNADPDYGPAEALIAASEAEIKHGGTRALYKPRPIDVIQMPSKRKFDTISHYYETLFHELTHWTADESRVGRKKKNDEAKADYAFEELVAEIGACFLMMELEVPLAEEMLEQSASYVQSWLAGMNDDPKFIFDAAAQASKATDYLLAFIGRQNPAYESEEGDGEGIEEAERAA